MPNRKEHQVVGGAAGSMLAGLWAASRNGTAHPSIVVGGLLGGFMGASIPDAIDTPDSPNHRGAGHSLALAGTIGAGCTASLPNLIEDVVRAQEIVDSYVEQGLTVPLLFELRLHFALLVLGFFWGVPAGLVSHLVLDGETPDGIRLFNRKV